VKSPKFQRRAEDRPREICTAALDVFSEKGFAAAKLDEIARRAGVSKGTLYLYFKDKEDLFRAVVRDTVAPNIETIRTLVEAADRPFAEIVRMFLPRFAAITTQVRVGAVAKMVIGESRNFPELAKVWHDEVVSKALGLISGLIERAQSRGEKVCKFSGQMCHRPERLRVRRGRSVSNCQMKSCAAGRFVRRHRARLRF
jgi:AcrR family transcriptional regulator